MTADPTTPAADNSPAAETPDQLPELTTSCADCGGCGTWYDRQGDPDLGIAPGNVWCAECDGRGWQLTLAGRQLWTFLQQVIA
jgi:hypothetical protein